MNKYTSAIDKIHVTAEMEKRIAAKLEEESRIISVRPQQSRNAFLKNMRLVYAVAACSVLVFSVVMIYFSLDHQMGPDPIVGVVNPYKAYGSIEELRNALPFELIVPSKIPLQYKTEEINSISGKMAYIRYSDGNETITFRAAAGSEDISGDSNIYDSIQTKTVSGMEVTLKGNDDLVYLAIWSDNTCSYALSTSQGISEAMALEMMQSLYQ